METNQQEEAREIADLLWKEDPQDFSLYFIQAQVQWRQQKIVEAKRNYILVFFNNLKDLPLKRVEPKSLRLIVENSPSFWVPFWGWLKQLLPLIHPDDNVIISLNEEQQQAVDFYRCLKAEQEALTQNNVKVSTKLRKKMKRINPIAFEAYFSLLKARKQ